jgi:antitoxin (DNA-binding transcriptional repressor) of toxin-antitoxin stability system
MMMSTVTLEEAQSRLAHLIEQLQPGEEIVITRDHKPIARLVAGSGPRRQTRRLGTMKGTVLHIADDFDAPLDDFREYIE